MVSLGDKQVTLISDKLIMGAFLSFPESLALDKLTALRSPKFSVQLTQLNGYFTPTVIVVINPQVITDTMGQCAAIL